MDQSALQRMKDKMHAKLNQHATSEMSVAQSPLEAYNQLPLKKVSEAAEK